MTRAKKNKKNPEAVIYEGFFLFSFLWAWGLNYVNRNLAADIKKAVEVLSWWDTLTYINYKSLAPSSGVGENIHLFLTFAFSFRDNEKLNTSVT